MKDDFGAHSLWNLPVLGPVHADTIITTWIAMAVALVLLGWVGNSYRSPLVNKRQAVVEGIVDYISDMVHSTVGPAGEAFVPFFISLFFFLFLQNQFGIFPFKALVLPFGGSPTADLNTVVPLALVVFFVIQISGFVKLGWRYPLHVFKPFWFLFPLNVLEELLRPTTLAARLFFNIFVGELLFIIIVQIIRAHVMIGPLNLSFAVAVLPVLIQFFNFFVGTIQAFIFTLLAIVYLSLAVAQEH